MDALFRSAGRADLQSKASRPGQVASWADLLNPALRGKIAFADPSVSGSSYTALVTMLCALGGDTDDVLQAFAENLDGKLLSGKALTGLSADVSYTVRQHTETGLYLVL